MVSTTIAYSARANSRRRTDRRSAQSEYSDHGGRLIPASSLRPRNAVKARARGLPVAAGQVRRNCNRLGARNRCNAAKAHVLLAADQQRKRSRFETRARVAI